MKTLMNSYQTTANRTLKGNKYPKQKKVNFPPREYGQWKIKLQAPGTKNTAYNTQFLNADVGAIQRRPSLRPAEQQVVSHPFATVSSYQDAYEKVDNSANRSQFSRLRHNTRKQTIVDTLGSLSNPKYMFYAQNVPFIESDPELLLVADPEVHDVPFTGSSHSKKVHRK